MKIVILAGGAGTRLWPLSRECFPKQLQPLFGKETLLQRTYRRLRRAAFGAGDVLVVTGANHARAVRAQLPELPRHSLLLEPLRRDSAGAIGFAAARVYRDHPDEVLVSVHADLYGITPTYPESGYGYIQVNKKVVHRAARSVYAVKRFVEKPSVRRARSFLSDPRYLWNPGWFAWRVRTLLGLYKEHLPKHYAPLMRIAASSRTDLAAVVRREFPRLPSISIDHGILERTDRRLVIPADIPWLDIGHWRAVSELSPKDAGGNASPGASVLLDSRDNFFLSSSGKLVAALGVENLVMVETDDVILLVDKSRAQEVKALVAELRKRFSTRYL
ncbi:MAG: mannose-1-phosphate guanylyltransferase [Parcubacteria group bacterium]|nr:mannose-1-phosphate guanylyltransferase [Parcubacteria group bacterium]